MEKQILIDWQGEVSTTGILESKTRFNNIKECIEHYKAHPSKVPPQYVYIVEEIYPKLKATEVLDLFLNYHDLNQDYDWLITDSSFTERLQSLLDTWQAECQLTFTKKVINTNKIVLMPLMK